MPFKRSLNWSVKNTCVPAGCRASTLAGGLIIVAAAVLAGGWIMARRRAAQSG